MEKTATDLMSNSSTQHTVSVTYSTAHSFTLIKPLTTSAFPQFITCKCSRFYRTAHKQNNGAAALSGYTPAPFELERNLTLQRDLRLSSSQTTKDGQRKKDDLECENSKNEPFDS